MFIKYRNTDLGLLLMRLALSAIFFFEGFSKLMDRTGTINFFSKIGFSPWLFYLVVGIELIGGIIFLLGILPEWGYVIAFEMAVIIFKLRLPHGLNSGFFELMILASALCFSLAGPGKYSIMGAKNPA